MDFNSTQFAKLSDIDVDEIDLYEDAWGLNAEFEDVFKFLDQLDITEDFKDFTNFKDFTSFTDSKPDL